MLFYWGRGGGYVYYKKRRKQTNELTLQRHSDLLKIRAGERITIIL